MPTIISGDGTITGLTSTGISAVQQLPAGSVLQVVNATYSTPTSTSGGTLVDTGLTASITPKFSNSKILVEVHQNGNFGSNTSDVGIRFVLLRNSSQIALIDGIVAYNGAGNSPIGCGSSSISYLDSPATTSAITYKTQFANRVTGSTGTVNVQTNSSVSTITLLEIAG